MQSKAELLETGRGILTGYQLQLIPEPEQTVWKNRIASLLTSADQENANITDIRNELAAVAVQIRKKAKITARNEIYIRIHQAKSREMVNDFTVGECVWFQEEPYTVQGKGSGKKEGRLLLSRSGDHHATACMPQNVVRFDKENREEQQRWIDCSRLFQSTNEYIDALFAGQGQTLHRITECVERHNKLELYVQKLVQIGCDETEVRSTIINAAITHALANLSQLRTKLPRCITHRCSYHDNCDAVLRRLKQELDQIVASVFDRTYGELFLKKNANR